MFLLFHFPDLHQDVLQNLSLKMIDYLIPHLPESATATKPRKTKRSVFVMLQDVLQSDVVDGIEISSDLRICLIVTLL